MSKLEKLKARMQNLTDLEKEFADELKNIFDDFEFISGNVLFLKPEEIKRTLEFIRGRENVTSSEVNVFALKLRLARKSNNN